MYNINQKCIIIYITIYIEIDSTYEPLHSPLIRPTFGDYNIRCIDYFGVLWHHDAWACFLGPSKIAEK